MAKDRLEVEAMGRSLMPLASDVLAYMMQFAIVRDAELQTAFGDEVGTTVDHLLDLKVIRLSSVGYGGRPFYQVQESWGDKF